jgi:hypothetical protein
MKTLHTVQTARPGRAWLTILAVLPLLFLPAGPSQAAAGSPSLPAPQSDPFQGFPFHSYRNASNSPLDIRIVPLTNVIAPVRRQEPNGPVYVLELPVRIENHSAQTISSSIPYESGGGLWTPGDLAAAVRPVNDTSTTWVAAPVFRSGEGGVDLPTTWDPGQSFIFVLRLNWPGTGSVRSMPLIDHIQPASYDIKFRLALGSEYVLSSSSRLEVRTNAAELPSPPVSYPPQLPGWGEPVDGVYLRLQADRQVWAADEEPTFTFQARNDGDHRTGTVPTDEKFGTLELDGTWYHFGAFYHPENPEKNLPLSQVSDPVRVTVNADWLLQNERLSLQPGKHSIRFATSWPEATGSPYTSARIISNPVEIEVSSNTSPVPKFPDDFTLSNWLLRASNVVVGQVVKPSPYKSQLPMTTLPADLRGTNYYCHIQVNTVLKGWITVGETIKINMAQGVKANGILTPPSVGNSLILFLNDAHGMHPPIYQTLDSRFSAQIETPELDTALQRLTQQSSPHPR